MYSKFGDVCISENQVSLNGMIYAPFGTVSIDCGNFNLNGLIIAQNIVINSNIANINYSASWAEFAGVQTEEFRWTFDDWEYLSDTDNDELPDLIEKEVIGSDPYVYDTDGDGLYDGYECMILNTDPMNSDTDGNDVSDYDEDYDEDNLVNGQEMEYGSKPYVSDTDGDTLSDGDEVTMFLTNPLVVDTDADGLDDDDEMHFGTDPNNTDTDGNGILDGNEKRRQTFTYKAENEAGAVTDVIISMNGTGNIQKNIEVESVMEKDVICSDVAGLVGEPYAIETSSEFDVAMITFKVDKSKLGDTVLDDLLFLWYDEENLNCLV